MLRLTTQDESWLTTMAEFLDDNRDDDEAVEAVKSLAVNQSCSLGGGAGVLFVVTRVSP